MKHIHTDLEKILNTESMRQENEINLIASENYASSAIQTVTASVLANKYAEGVPGKRYYPGCINVDKAELLAIEYCKKLFGVDYVNVQAHSGSQANTAVYFAALKPGDTILGMALNAGGHLTHGHKVNISGSWFNSVQYGVNRETEQLDYEEIRTLAHMHKPKLIVVGASAYSRTIDYAQMREIADSVDALLLADIAHIAGLIATGLHPNPASYADFITSTTHKTLRGPRGGLIMCKAKYAEIIDRAIMPGTQGGPFMNIIAAKAQAFYEALQPDFKIYQENIIKNAQAMTHIFANLGYRIVAGGTDTHLFILDLHSQGITGLQAEQALEKAGITVSRSCIPFDNQKPWITSGIRIGTPAITTRGMLEEHATQIAYLIDEVIQQHENEFVLAQVRAKAAQLCKKFPIKPAQEHTFVNQQTNSIEFSR